MKKRPRIKIRFKLALTYLLVIAAILFIINSQVTRALKNNYLDEEAAKSLANANIIAIAGKDIILYNDPNSSSFIRSYSEHLSVIYYHSSAPARDPIYL